MAAQRLSSPHIAAHLIAAIGRPEFPGRLLSVYRDLADCDLCSAFVWEAEGGPRLLFAAGVHPAIPGFALAASRAYARRFWRLDPMALRRCAHDCAGPSLLCTTAANIGDPDYRRECYQRGGIGERLTLFDTSFPALSVSGYRSVSRGPVTSYVVRRMQETGPVLVAALRRHHELIGRPAHATPAASRSILLQRADEWGLSAREAEVAAGLATGESQPEIARRSGLALSSVITYRRRAYLKLRVADRLELVALCERLAMPAEP